MAIGIILIDLTPGYNVDLMSYLFGSILAVSNNDIIYMSILLLIIGAIVAFYYKNILAVSYDKEYARLRGINVNFFYTLILVLSSLAIVVAIKVVGLILVIALLTIPIYMAQDLSNSLKNMMIISSLLSSIFTIVGLVLSYSYDLSSGASIIIVSALSLLLFTTIKGIIKNG
jgi:zinc transport system permease protein